VTEDLLTYLKSDATLTGLIGSGTACRLYPDFGPKDPTAPYVVYRIQSDPGRIKGNQVRERMYGFSIFAATALAAETIERRLDILLDKDADIAVTSTSYYIKASRHSGGTSMYEQDTKLHHRAALYTLLYVEK
jgi:hypothetical protein